MRKTILKILLILFLLFPSMSYARQIGFLIEEADGAPADYVYKLKVTNGTLAIAGNVATLTIGGGSATQVNDALGDLYDTAAELTALFDARCLESVFGTALGTGLTLDVTTLKTHVSLQSIAGLTEADVSILETTADNAYAVVTSGGNDYLLGSNAGNTALEFKTPAGVKSDLDLEVGTDFYSIAAADAAFEAELNNSAGLLAALSDETGTGVAVFGTAPTFTTSITMGSAGLTEPELEILDGATLSTTQINYLNTATGTTGTNTTNLVYSASPTFTGTAIFATINVGTLVMDASATPQWVFRDSGNPGTDKEIAKISANFLSGADGAEDGALYLWAMLGGSEILWFAWNSDTEAITMGDSGTGEDLIWDFETATDNEVAVSTNSGTTQINFGTLNLLTTGTIQGAITINSDADGMTQANMTAVGMYGSAFFATGAGTWNLPAAAAGMSFVLYSTGANAIIINPDDADTITYAGVKDTAGHQIASPSAAGDYIAMIALNATDWYVLGHSGTWVPGA